MSFEHRLDAGSKLIVKSNNFIEATHGKEKSLLDSPVRVAASGNCIGVLLHVVSGEPEEGHQVVGLSLSLLCGLELTDELNELDSGHLWHVDRLHDVLLFTNVLNWVIGKELLVTVRDNHEGNSCFVQDVVDKRKHFVHGGRDLCRRRDKLDHEVEGL